MISKVWHASDNSLEWVWGSCPWMPPQMCLSRPGGVVVLVLVLVDNDDAHQGFEMDQSVVRSYERLVKHHDRGHAYTS